LFVWQGVGVGETVASLHPGLELAECRFIHDAAFSALPSNIGIGGPEL